MLYTEWKLLSQIQMLQQELRNRFFDAVDSVEDMGQRAKEASDAVHRMETNFTDADAPTSFSGA